MLPPDVGPRAAAVKAGLGNTGLRRPLGHRLGAAVRCGRWGAEAGAGGAGRPFQPFAFSSTDTVRSLRIVTVDGTGTTMVLSRSSSTNGPASRVPGASE